MAIIKHHLAEHAAKIKELYEEGVPTARLARRFGVTLEQMRYFVRINNFKKK